MSISAASCAERESMKRLLALKEKIQQQYQEEHNERVRNETREQLVPFSLAADYGSTTTVAAPRARTHTSGTTSGPGGLPNASAGASTPLAPSKQATSSTINNNNNNNGINNNNNNPSSSSTTKSQIEKAVAILRDKIPGVKQLDKYMQRDLDIELEKKATEMVQLKAHNQRLREIISLRQESNTRRERTFEAEVLRVKSKTDEVCIDARNEHVAMQDLRRMNREVQAGAQELRDTIATKAEAERLALIRTYRVRLREVKQLLKNQEAANLEGASAWIRRYNILETDHQAAVSSLEDLQSKISALQAENKELAVMKRHQDDQRESIALKIAMIKRENKRFEHHIELLERQSSHFFGGSGTDEGQRPATTASGIRSLRTGLSRTALPPASASQPPRRASSSTGPRKPLLDMGDRRKQDAIDKTKRMLEEMRNSLRKVRSAHVELLQERSEIEMFVRQCIEDVRRELYRYTVLNNLSLDSSQDSATDGFRQLNTMLRGYGVKDRKRLLDILQSKIQVLTLLHQKMFPGKELQGPTSEPLGEFLQQQKESEEEAKREEEIIRAKQQQQGPTPATHELDDLWDSWKKWTRSVTPS